MIPLHLSSQHLFGFLWTDPITNHTQQLTWIILPQRFRDPPHLFGQALQQDINSLNLFPSKFIYYVDDIFLFSPSKYSCENHTIILNSLAHCRFWVLRNKAQLISTSVSLMGLLLTPGYHPYLKIPNSKYLSQNKKGKSFFFRINWVF
jgi:hypothetical protein